MKTDRRHLPPEGLAKLESYAGDWTVLLDETSRIVYELGSCDILFGGKAQSVSIGRRIAAFVHPDDMVLATDMMADSLSELGTPIAFKIRAGFNATSYRMVDVLAVELLQRS